MSTTPPVESATSPARARMLDALAGSVADKGFSATTITDVVGRAHVSRRTFYEHFTDKEDCLLACHHAFSAALAQKLSDASQRGTTSTERITGTVAALLAALQQHPAEARVYFVEMAAAGDRPRQARRETQHMLATLLQELALRGSQRNPAMTAITHEMALALVGAISELILDASERDALDQLGGLAPTIESLITAVLLGNRD
ncbi:TetR/AcrR family transcriptional regulator [Lolliginicoccus suaedae]|uniref:TetR/AcrR family transcriptional regulator n=1 Tax=Lolliginicoccus suaedae TaxID=2605429 RepID=UPI00165927D2|nr:TetR/AcrR family transcriptional regulator [Lolliginicoccus suaedae]